MQEMRAALQREHDIFIREKAEWHKSFEVTKSQTTLQIENERREHLASREEQTRMYFLSLES